MKETSFSIYLVCVLLLVGMGCQDNSQKKARKTDTESKEKEDTVETISAKDTAERKVLKPSFTKINDDNVKQRLLEFGKKNPETVVDIYTTKGKVRAKLYETTPLHRANFILMAKKGFYEGSVFTRVAPKFIAQGGGTYNKEQVDIKKSIGSYTIPNEISKQHFHKRGALGAARRYNFNPDKRSDPYAFYFVEGNTYNNPTLDEYERVNNYTYPQAHRDYYNNIPGAAHIDGQHTVFGEIIEGFKVIPEITHVRTDSRDWPVKDIYIDSVKVIR